MRKRTQAREIALQFLYMLDLRHGEGKEEFDRFARESSKEEETLEFAKRLVDGVQEEKISLDEKIQGAAKNWQLSRMAVIDRNILRIAVYEILRCQDVPPKVAINEAIDLGKKFSTEHSGAFINGVLDKIRADFAPGK